MEKINDAIKFATDAHSGQFRKLGGLPYILHPLEVMAIAGTLTKDEDVMCAAALHDTVEDTNVTNDEIKERFGQRVAMLVSYETENKRRELPAEQTWKIRKVESIKHLEESNDIGVKILWLADKLSNVRSFYRSYITTGDAIWSNFNQKDKKEQAWYYREIYRILKPSFHNTLEFLEFEGLIKALFGKEVCDEI